MVYSVDQLKLKLRSLSVAGDMFTRARVGLNSLKLQVGRKYRVRLSHHIDVYNKPLNGGMHCSTVFVY